MINCLNIIFNLQVDIRIKHQKWQFYLKKHEDIFEERYNFKDKIKVFYIK
jgi:hypothetical protein